MKNPEDPLKYPKRVSVETRPLTTHFMIWAPVGLLCVYFANTPWPILLAAVGLGVAGGAAHAWLLAHVRFVAARWTGVAVALVLLALYFGLAVPRQWPIGAPIWMAALGVGALTSAFQRLVVWLAIDWIERVLNERYLGTQLDPDQLRPNPEWIKPPPAFRHPPPPPDDPWDDRGPSIPLEEALAEMEKLLPPELYQLLEQQPAWPLRCRLPATDPAPPAASRLGGNPCVPADFIWPVVDETPLGFLGQINLEEVPNLEPKTSLPAKGLIAFFLDFQRPPWGSSGDQDHAKVFYFPEVADCEAIASQGTNWSPRMEPTVAGGYATRFLEVDTVREFEAVQEWIRRDSIENRGESFGTELENYAEAAFHNWGHQFLGDGEFWWGSNPVDRPDEANQHFGLPDENNWRLLLKVSSDDELGWMWGDVGTLSVWIPETDLPALRFDRVWVTVDCS